MKRSKKIILLFSSISIMVLASSCKKQHTVVEASWPDGTPRKVCIYLGTGDSREMLKETSWYPNKQMEMNGSYKNNLRDGLWTAWYKNGNKWSEGFFKKGLNDGKRTTWYENGKIRYEAWYREGIKVGKWRFYDETGRLVKEVNYTAQ
jgi:hypothetical protein